MTPTFNIRQFTHLYASNKLAAEASDFGFGPDPRTWIREFFLEMEFPKEAMIRYTMFGGLETKVGMSITYKCGEQDMPTIIIFND